MNYLLDANVIISYLRGEDQGTKVLEEVFQRVDGLYVSVLTRFEVLRLVRPKEEGLTKQVFQLLQHVELDVEIADAAIGYAQKFQKAYGAIDVVDYLIAATAHQYDLPLITFNAKHFPMRDIQLLNRDFVLDNHG